MKENADKVTGTGRRRARQAVARRRRADVPAAVPDVDGADGRGQEVPDAAQGAGADADDAAAEGRGALRGCRSAGSAGEAKAAPKAAVKKAAAKKAAPKAAAKTAAAKKSAKSKKGA